MNSRFSSTLPKEEERDCLVQAMPRAEEIKKLPRLRKHYIVVRSCPHVHCLHMLFSIHFVPDFISLCYKQCNHIRPQIMENRASRPLCRTQTINRISSSAVGDHVRIRSAVCFAFCYSFGPRWTHESPCYAVMGNMFRMRGRPRPKQALKYKNYSIRNAVDVS